MLIIIKIAQRSADFHQQPAVTKSAGAELAGRTGSSW